jgi:hypothetical protein
VSLDQDFRSSSISKRRAGVPADHVVGHDVIISPDDCSSKRVLALHDYWQRVRGDRPMPRREDIDPLEIWSLLPYVHVTEWHTNPDRVFIRITGTEIVATAGVEMGGRWLSEMHPNEEDLEQIMALYHRVVATRVPIFGRTDGTTLRLGVEFFEWVLCPLSEDGRNVTHFVGLEDYVSVRRYLGGAA